ncbi:MAG: hypothetical protein IJH64_10145 [Oscillospiraceae bacterium]|jgi:hypothetical protein|nr:hypothetical protein [Oscillospiraceae bacterium]
MEWQHSGSTICPQRVDTTLSQIYVYIRKNIVETERTDMSGETITYYEYDEAMIPREDYFEIEACMTETNEQTQSNAEDISDTREGLIETSEETENNASDIAELRAAVMELAEEIES